MSTTVLCFADCTVPTSDCSADSIVIGEQSSIEPLLAILTNVTVFDLSNNISFHYRVLPLIEQSGDIYDIDKTVVFNMD